MEPKYDLSGKKFGRWNVLEKSVLKKQQRESWLCECDCGTQSILSVSSLLSGNSKSCGCYRKSKAVVLSTKHGMSGTPEYNSWRGMIQRCINPKCNIYSKYGARGIGVCERWMSFDAFYEDMGIKPTHQCSLDRIDNSKGYCPENCRWATPIQQANNTRRNKKIEVDGVTLTCSQWAEKAGIASQLIARRISNGWTGVEAVFGRKPPVYKSCRNVKMFDPVLYDSVMSELRR